MFSDEQTIKVNKIILPFFIGNEDYRLFGPLNVSPMNLNPNFILSNSIQQANFTVQALDDQILENKMEKFDISISVVNSNVRVSLGNAEEEITIVDNER